VEKDFSIEFNITQGGLAADMRIVPGSGEVPSLSVEEIMKAIQDEGITYGVLTEVVEQVAREKTLNTWVTIAKGVEPSVGKDGYVKFHFETERTKVRLKEDASGRVNLRDLNLIQNVKKGDILCELMPPETGTSGMTVKGEEILGKMGAHAKLPGGQNVSFSADHTTILSGMDGMVTWADSSIIVDHVYVVDTVDANIGNIRFNGSVVVNGEVGDGYEIHAGEDITIAMSVGRVVLNAGGNITINGGILGQDMTTIDAGGKIRVRFIQDTPHVKSGAGIIVDDYIRNSVVTAVSPIAIKNQNGWIDSSTISSECWIYCPTIGYETSAVETNLCIGHNPILIQERGRLREDIVYKISEFLKLQSSLMKLRALKTMNQMSQQQELLYNKILDNIERLRNTLTMHDTRIGEITENINRVYAGNIYIEGIINENTNINIGAVSKKITNAKARVHFFLNEGEIAESEFLMVPEIKKVLESG
jgi:uncharacterized protein (DUF342 family)